MITKDIARQWNHVGGSDCSVRLNPSGTAGGFLRKPALRAATDNDKSVALA